MNYRFRLTRSIDFTRVRNQGKSFAHPLVVLVKLQTAEDHPRVGLSTSRTVGNAVQRNRAKRLLRESLRSSISLLSPGWDVVLIARNRIVKASFQDVKKALDELFRRAGLWESAVQSPGSPADSSTGLAPVVDKGEHVR